MIFRNFILKSKQINTRMLVRISLLSSLLPRRAAALAARLLGSLINQDKRKAATK
jgi:hypothetical protein